MPYVLFSFVSDHTMETCEKIYKVLSHYIHVVPLSNLLNSQAPVALAMWNQIGAEGRLLARLTRKAYLQRHI